MDQSKVEETRMNVKGSQESCCNGTKGCHDDCLYDFSVIHSDKDSELCSRFFNVLEDRFQLKGYHSQRDQQLGKLRRSELVLALQSSRYIIELISPDAADDKRLRRLRTTAHQLQCNGIKYPKLLHIFVNLDRQARHRYSATVGKVFADDDNFWRELSSYLLGNSIQDCNGHQALSPLAGRRNDLKHSLSLENNNNNPEHKDLEEPASRKIRRKHKVFTGLFSNKKKRKQSVTRKRWLENKKSENKSKKRRKLLRRLLLCVPSQSKSPPSFSPPYEPSSSTGPVNGSVHEKRCGDSSGRCDISRS
ncbi:uncharacterized protein [Diadema antillarum]|uniref:uncharacterized protein isoform X1 n=1 Tax=Diadema antillarum TaxID=105358 RepID=UPI003A845B78